VNAPEDVFGQAALVWAAQSGDADHDTAHRILDAAGELFGEVGVRKVGMDAIGRRAGLSRATVYRHFPDRATLHVAFVAREAAGLLREVMERVDRVEDPAERTIRGLTGAIAAVRSNPVLAAWVDVADAATTMAVALDPVVITLLHDRVEEPHDAEAVQWLVRVMLSLLHHPAADTDEERRLIERFVTPVLTLKADLG